jgi:PAS domain S-box-containing protein
MSLPSGLGEQRRRRRHGIEDAQRLLAAIVENSDDAIIGEDLDGVVTSWNKAAERILGYTADEMIGRPLAVIARPDRPDEMQAILARVRRGESLNHFETERRRKDGTLIPVSLTVSPIRDSDGCIIGASTILRHISERKRIEAALRESEQHFRCFVELSPQVPWTAGPDGAILDFNQRWLDLTGLTRDEALGEGWARVPHPEDLPLMAEAWTRSLQTGDPYDVEHRIRLADGSYRWMRSRAYPRRDRVSGKIVRWYGTTEDIDDRKRAEAALREGELRFRTMADSIPQLAWTARPDGWIYWYNKRWYDYTGTTLDEVEGFDWRKVHHPDHVDRVVAHFRRSWEAGEPWEDTFPLRGKDGAYRWFLSRALPVRDPNGRIAMWFGTNTDITGRLEAEAALRESEATLRGFYESAPTLMGIVELVDDDILHVYDNPTTCRFFGVRAESVEGRRASEIGIPPSAIAEWIAHYREAQRRGEPVDFEYPHRDGESRRWLWATVAVIGPGPSGRTRFCYVAEDITDRKRAEARFRSLFEASPVAAYVTDAADLSIEDCNEAAAAMLRYHRDELRGLSLRVVDAGQSAEQIRARAAGTIEEGVLRFETRHRTRSGALRDVVIATVPVTDPDGRRLFYSTVLDVTERKRAEAALRDSEERFRSTFEQAAVGMAEVGRDGRWLRINARLAEITGYPPDELHRLTFQDITHPDDLDADLEQVRRLVAGEIQTYGMEKRYVRKDGTTVWVNLTVGLVRHADGTPRHFVAVVEDIDARKAAEAEVRRLTETLERRVEERTRQLAEANRELEAFAYSVSHDLRAPLRTMQGFGQALIEDYGDRFDGPGMNYIRRIVAGAARMDELILDLLAYSRITRAEIERQPVTLDRIVDDVLGQLRADIEAKAAAVDVVRPLGRVLGQRSIVTQVVSNLVGNALKFVAPGVTPRVRIRVEDRPGPESGGARTVRRLWVEDNGIGIAREHRERIFQIFQRLHGAAEYPGTGIGLAIVRKGIERLGGAIGVESDPGEGSRFWIDLPAAEGR